MSGSRGKIKLINSVSVRRRRHSRNVFKNLMSAYDSSKEFCRKTGLQKFAGSDPFESQMGEYKFFGTIVARHEAQRLHAEHQSAKEDDREDAEVVAT